MCSHVLSLVCVGFTQHDRHSVNTGIKDSWKIRFMGASVLRHPTTSPPQLHFWQTATPSNLHRQRSTSSSHYHEQLLDQPLFAACIFEPMYNNPKVLVLPSSFTVPRDLPHIGSLLRSRAQNRAGGVVGGGASHTDEGVRGIEPALKGTYLSEDEQRRSGNRIEAIGGRGRLRPLCCWLAKEKVTMMSGRWWWWVENRGPMWRVNVTIMRTDEELGD